MEGLTRLEKTGTITENPEERHPADCLSEPLIDFQSTKENSFESLMTLTNRTKVAIAVVGTEDAYSKMFTHLRTARRLGNIISGNLYCENRTYFSILAKRVFKYQWFDSPVEMTNDMLEALYRNTHGIIDQLVGLCMYLNLDYISSKSRPTIDADYINKVAKRHYRGIQKGTLSAQQNWFLVL